MRSDSSKPQKQTRRPATTQEGEENQVIAMAYDLAKKQLSDGTASSQVITHFLKLGTEKEQLEKQKLREENALLRAKVEGIASGKRVEEMYEKALNAMRMYQGQDPEDFYED